MTFMPWSSRGWLKVQHKDPWADHWTKPVWFFNPSSGARGGIVMAILILLGTALFIITKALL